MTSIEYYNTSTDTTPAKTVTFNLDSNGNILTVDDSSMSPSQIYTHTYDNLSRIDTVTANNVNKLMDYDYDPFGNRNKLTVKEGSAAGATLFTYNYTYNKLEQLTSLSAPGGTTSFDYLPTGRLETKTFPNGVAGNYAYTANGNLENLTYTSGTAAPLLALSYSYDNAYNIDTKTKDGVLYDYGYDDLYQLTGVTIPSTTSQNESFNYDAVGNRLSSIDKPTWNYDNNNQLNSYNGVSFGSDANGNTTSKADPSGTTNYTYSINNRLSTVTTPTISASYHYDPMGRRIRKTVNGTTTNYLWDENALLAELDDLNNISKLYTYNPQTNELISMTEGSDTYYSLNDHLITPQKIVDSSGAVVWAAEHKAFGEITIEPSSTIINNLRFPGQYFDAETGLHYNYHRYYDPRTGRYLTPDPSHFLQPRGTEIPYLLPFLLTLPQEINLYPYVQRNPINHADIRGLQTCPRRQQCIDDAVEIRNICTKVQWASEVLCIAACAAGCTIVPGYLECFLPCAGACHLAFAANRAICWAVFLTQLHLCYSIECPELLC